MKIRWFSHHPLMVCSYFFLVFVFSSRLCVSKSKIDEHVCKTVMTRSDSCLYVSFNIMLVVWMLLCMLSIWDLKQKKGKKYVETIDRVSTHTPTNQADLCEFVSISIATEQSTHNMHLARFDIHIRAEIHVYDWSTFICR